MIELSLPRSPRFLINTLVLTLLLFGVYYRPLPYSDNDSQPLHKKLTDAYYAAFWQEAAPRTSPEGVALQALWPLYVSSLVEREIVIGITNNTTATLNAIVVITAYKDFAENAPATQQQWLIWQSESQPTSNGYGGRSVLNLGDVPPRGQVTESLWVKVSPVGQPPESVFFRAYVYWTYPEDSERLCRSSQESPPCELIAPTAPRTYVDPTQTVWQGIVKALLLPPLNNLLLPVLALFLTLSYEGLLAMLALQWQGKRKTPPLVQNVLTIARKFVRTSISKMLSLITENRLVIGIGTWRQRIREKIGRHRRIQGIVSIALIPVVAMWWLVMLVWGWLRNNLVYLLGSILLYSYALLLLWEIVTLATYLLDRDANLLTFISQWSVIGLVLISLLTLIYAQGQLVRKEPELAFSDKGLEDIERLINGQRVVSPSSEMRDEDADETDPLQSSTGELAEIYQAVSEIRGGLTEVRQLIDDDQRNCLDREYFDSELSEIRKQLGRKVNSETHTKHTDRIRKLEEFVHVASSWGETHAQHIDRTKRLEEFVDFFSRRALQKAHTFITYFQGHKSTRPVLTGANKEEINHKNQWEQLEKCFAHPEIQRAYQAEYEELQEWWASDKESDDQVWRESV
jgi:hypothetical protein